MPLRVAAEATPEPDLDISGNLVGDHDADDAGALHSLDINHDTENFLRSGSEDGDVDAFIATQQAAVNRRTANVKGISKRKGGFQSMGLSAQLLKAVTRKGFSLPTPIQRQIIPAVLDGQDVVGMARTGSGKTAAFVIPIIEKLKVHNTTVGARTVVFSPSRELALQTLKNFKEFGRGTGLRTVLLVGGDSLEEQFRELISNPDIIIATPGRFMHLQVEMSLDLSAIQFAVFDEADRLFEMGFSQQLTEILHALPTSRQTMLFSATLPNSLIEFAKAGLKDPELVRLDAESKISPDLQSVFLTLKSAEKEGVLLHILHDLIKMPQSSENKRDTQEENSPGKSKKRKTATSSTNAKELPTENSTIVFAATKHHVEYLSALLQACGFSVSFVYGSLNQTARRIQVEKFRSGATQILVVTDVAARGIDIPMLANVINYDFPSQPKVFIHRVGRTARAGSKGWSYNLVQDADIPYLLDVQEFLGRKLLIGNKGHGNYSFAQDVAIGSIPRAQVEKHIELASKLLDEAEDLGSLRNVATKGEKLYKKTRNPASTESARRAKQVSLDPALQEANLLYKDATADSLEAERDQMLARISGFRPSETIFEIGKRGDLAGAAEVVRKNREKAKRRQPTDEVDTDAAVGAYARNEESTTGNAHDDYNEMHLDASSEDDVEVFIEKDQKRGKKQARSYWRDTQNFMSYEPEGVNAVEERGYAVNSGSHDRSRASNFSEAAQNATLDLAADEPKSFAEPSRMRWDKRGKKYVSTANDEDGSKGKRMIKGESGQMIASSFRSGRFDAWKKANRLGRLPRTGEQESASQHGPSSNARQGRRYKHDATKAPKRPDKYRDDFHKQKQRTEQARSRDPTGPSQRKAKDELRNVEDVRKARKLKQRRREKNARPSKRKVA